MIRFVSFIIRLLKRPIRYPLIIYKPDRLGDFILALETIRKLIERYGKRNTLIIVSPQGQSMSARFLPGVSVLCLESGCNVKRISQLPQLLAEFWRLASLTADTMVSLKHHKREIDYIYENVIHANAKFSIKGDLSINRFSSLADPSVPYPAKSLPGVCREVVAHHALYLHVTSERDDVTTFSPHYPAPTQFERRGPTIISPFGSKHLRDISPDQVYNLLPETTTESIVIGSRDQMDKLRVFAEQLESLGARYVSVKVFADIDAYMDAIKEAGFVISTETATAHFAIAFDRPGIGFLGGGHFGYFAPWGRGPFEWRFKKMDCYNCDWQCRYKNVRCLTEL